MIFRVHKGLYRANINFNKGASFPYVLDTGCSIITVPLFDICSMYNAKPSVVTEHLKNFSDNSKPFYMANNASITVIPVVLRNVVLGDLKLDKMYAITSTQELSLQRLLGNDIVRCSVLSSNDESIELSTFYKGKYETLHRNFNGAEVLGLSEDFQITELNIAHYCIKYLKQHHLAYEDPILMVAAMCNPSWDGSSEPWKRAAHVIKQELGVV